MRWWRPFSLPSFLLCCCLVVVAIFDLKSWLQSSKSTNDVETKKDVMECVEDMNHLRTVVAAATRDVAFKSLLPPPLAISYPGVTEEIMQSSLMNLGGRDEVLSNRWRRLLIKLIGCLRPAEVGAATVTNNKTISIAFSGGSITQGRYVRKETRYAGVLMKWFRDSFPLCSFVAIDLAENGADSLETGPNDIAFPAPSMRLCFEAFLMYLSVKRFPRTPFATLLFDNRLFYKFSPHSPTYHSFYEQRLKHFRCRRLSENSMQSMDACGILHLWDVPHGFILPESYHNFNFPTSREELAKPEWSLCTMKLGFYKPYVVANCYMLPMVMASHVMKEVYYAHNGTYPDEYRWEEQIVGVRRVLGSREFLEQCCCNNSYLVNADDVHPCAGGHYLGAALFSRLIVSRLQTLLESLDTVGDYGDACSRKFVPLFDKILAQNTYESYAGFFSNPIERGNLRVDKILYLVSEYVEPNEVSGVDNCTNWLACMRRPMWKPEYGGIQICTPVQYMSKATLRWFPHYKMLSKSAISFGIPLWMRSLNNGSIYEQMKKLPSLSRSECSSDSSHDAGAEDVLHLDLTRFLLKARSEAVVTQRKHIESATISLFLLHTYDSRAATHLIVGMNVNHNGVWDRTERRLPVRWEQRISVDVQEYLGEVESLSSVKQFELTFRMIDKEGYVQVTAVYFKFR